jgi:hypothetical protein
MKTFALIAGAAGLFGLIAPAVSAPPAEPTANKSKSDPNERVCENITPVGSRLGGKRVCATRAEWAEKRRQDQDAIDRAQVSACMITTTGRGGAAC